MTVFEEGNKDKRSRPNREVIIYSLLTSEELKSFSWEERMEYEDKLKRYRDWHNVIDTAKREVRLKIAKKAKTIGITIDIIQKATNLSKEKIENL